MKVFHNSRDARYRSPYGAVAAGTEVTLAVDVSEGEAASVVLRTWIDGEGEGLVAMQPAASVESRDNNGNSIEDTSMVRYEVGYTPQDARTVWYQFIVTDAAGNVQRYGAQDGRFGGEGQLVWWEPPSFQLAVYDEADSGACGGFAVDEAAGHAVAWPFAADVVKFVREEETARELAEAIEAYREAAPAAALEGPFDLLEGYDDEQVLVLLSGVLPAGMTEVDSETAYEVADGQRGLAKGRMWCAGLIQGLAPGTGRTGSGEKVVPSEPSELGDPSELGESSDPSASSAEDDEGQAPAHTGASAAASRIDRDCQAIRCNVFDLRQALPAFSRGTYECFAANDDVFGFWRRLEGEATACVLVNRSLSYVYDIDVPLAGDAVTEVVSGYEAKVSEDRRMVRVHLNQLGSAVLHFHGTQRLERPMEPGVGVLAHITSMPSNGDETESDQPGTGTLGASARAFVDWLADAGVRYWQVLPVNPTDDHGSPYAGISAFAGNIRLLEGYDGTLESLAGAAEADAAGYRDFCEREQDWLEPYVAFMAIRQKLGAGKVWQKWPKKYRQYKTVIIEGDKGLAAGAEQWRRAQFAFEVQWHALRAYANERGIQIVGDMPIYVSSDSSDVWANPEFFQLDKAGAPAVVAGCPPDQFAVEGQVWGNPVYDWDVLAGDGYSWWMKRLERAFELYDVVRLDHFIGFSRYFSIPKGQKATAGAYHAGPGRALFDAAYQKFGPLPIIAEDLGSITPSVRALGAECGFPGMDIVQFVDGNDPLSWYQPRPEKIAYTGTHDNQTLVGYVEQRYPGEDAQEAARKIADAVARCSADVCVVPLQDVLGLDDEARMNVPGTAEGNWIWQADAASIEQASSRMRELVELHENR